MDCHAWLHVHVHGVSHVQGGQHAHLTSVQAAQQNSAAAPPYPLTAATQPPASLRHRSAAAHCPAPGCRQSTAAAATVTHLVPGMPCRQWLDCSKQRQAKQGADASTVAAALQLQWAAAVAQGHTRPCRCIWAPAIKSRPVPVTQHTCSQQPACYMLTPHLMGQLSPSSISARLACTRCSCSACSCARCC